MVDDSLLMQDICAPWASVRSAGTRRSAPLNFLRFSEEEDLTSHIHRQERQPAVTWRDLGLVDLELIASLQICGVPRPTPFKATLQLFPLVGVCCHPSSAKTLRQSTASFLR